MITRADVINNARAYLNPQSWSPLNDKYVFDSSNPDSTFHSAFVVGQSPYTPASGQSLPIEYNVMPYVFGGFDSKTQFVARISNRTCPGGWDRVSGHNTHYWYDDENGFRYRERVPRALAGIDCSGYVLRSWGFSRRDGFNTRTLPNICMKIENSSLKPGDILNKKSHHVRIFEQWGSMNKINGQVKIYEAAGGAKKRAFISSDEIGRVVYHTIDWDPQYIPYSPFPQLIEGEPHPATYPRVENSRPTIRAKIQGSGNLEVTSLGINNHSVTFAGRSVQRGMEIIHKPNCDLSVGLYVVRIAAMNNVGGQTFVEELTWEFILD